LRRLICVPLLMISITPLSTPLVIVPSLFNISCPRVRALLPPLFLSLVIVYQHVSCM
ncbi:hypothetical protein B0H11DRAFT_2042807, partial [Mycena galericulata]